MGNSGRGAHQQALSAARAVYEASLDEERMGTVNPTILLGYVKPGGTRVLFSGDLTQIPVKLEARDKVILFSAH